MRRRALLLAAALGLLATSLIHSPIAVSSCDECASDCNQIPMDTQECLQMYCPDCAGSSLPVGGRRSS
jgi:hypothetical protein